LSKYQPKNGDPNLFFGPPIGKNLLVGDGSRGIMEGHASAVNLDGSQQYRYFVRADVQGESAFMLAASGSLLNSLQIKKHPKNYWIIFSTLLTSEEVIKTFLLIMS
jgi:hypothetical protein